MSPNKEIIILKNRLGFHGGLEKYTWRIAEAFAKKSLKVTFFTSDNVENAIDHNFFNFRIVSQKKPFFSYKKIKNFDRACLDLLKNRPSGIVLGLDRNSFQTHLRAGNGVHRAYLNERKKIDPLLKRLTNPFNPLHRHILSLEKQAFESQSLRKIFTNSFMVKQQILEHYNTCEKKIDVIHNGVEWEEMQKDFDNWLEKKSKIAHLLHLDPACYHFLFIGHGYKRKGLDVLLEALALLKNKDFHLSVLGKDKDIHRYIKKTKRLKLEHKVSFYGKRSDVIKFYQLCDCLVIPSYYDPFANVTVEALAMGLHVISSPYNGGKEVLNKEFSHTLSTLDPEELADCMQQAMNKPKTWLRALSIRLQAKHLDFSHQIGTLVDSCLENSSIKVHD